jgi:glutathione-specific gamma-glutamylcyclotransferase
MRKLTLTAEHIAKIQRVEPDEGPSDGRLQMTDADYSQWADDLLEELTGTSLRVFGYGSLIWKPEFEFISASRGWLHGWHRSFCMHIDRWRGTRAVPGLMMALDSKGSCNGMIYELSDENKKAQVEKLLRREMTNKPPTNVPRVLKANMDGKMVRVIAFTSNPDGAHFVKALPLEDVAKVLARAAGHWGTGAEYLFNTVSHLEQLGIEDRNLWKLQKLVAAEIEKL